MSARPSRENAPQAFNSTTRPERQPAPQHLASDYSYSISEEKDAESPALPSVSFAPQSHGTYTTAGAANDNMKRKRSLVRPERERLNIDSPLWNYRHHAAAMQADGIGRIGLSSTGNYPQAGIGLERAVDQYSSQQPPVSELKRGVSILARDEPGQNILRRGATIRKSKGRVGRTEELRDPVVPRKPLSPWMVYATLITSCFPSALLNVFGLHSKERQRAWREKVALLSIVLLLMAGVGYLTFGFTQTVCGKEPLRFNNGKVAGGSMIFHGWDYSMDKFEHPGAAGIVENSNPLYQGFNTGGMDGSFLFQKVNQHCLDIITPAAGTGIPHSGNQLAWYFPCNFFNQYGTTPYNLTGYTEGTLCHTQDDARTMFLQTSSSSIRGMKREGAVYYTWDQVRNASRNLGVYQQTVLDFSLLNWLDDSQVSFPAIFSDLARGNASYRGNDITMQILRAKQDDIAACLVDIITVGSIDSHSIGCVASDVVLYASLIVIIGVVVIKFCMAVIFGWFVSWRLGNYKRETRKQQRARADEIENWSEDIYRPAPARYRPNVKKSMLPTKSRFSSNLKAPLPNRYNTYQNYSKTSVFSATGKPTGAAMRNSPPSSPGGLRVSPSSSSLATPTKDSRRSSLSFDGVSTSGPICPWALHNVVPQPPASYEPFNFPLAHTLCLVTAYSESTEGLRTTLDSLATTDYPNSHKLLLIVADGMVKGSGNKLTTPEIVLTMMKDFIIPPSEVEPNSYVAIADGHKRHNMAKVFAGFYSYDDGTVETSKQQRVPMILVAKVGNPLEAHDPKPGNRGKRDSQVLLMQFLQKVMFDERMTTFEYEFFNAIWRCTGVTPDQFQLSLMVDADTKVFPDSLTRMVACMVDDPEIMGLCGETKIANKTETWVTMIQVFEYYLAHHQTKAFEAMFGGVTCLPGCFSMYRIKAPKGGDGFWVPIIANPDVVEHYSENVVDTLHKKNLLLLGEDRYLSTLMLKTFPRRKMMFCPQAVCKTIVPDTFRVLLSQRRRWINSTVHNLFELLLVRDLCGTFCFSMQFVVFMDLVGTLVLPAAIAFTIYLLIISCIPGHPKPVLSLILLAIILGLPGLLIVITSRKIVYVGWMLIYLFSLPVWNFVLPFYSYLHMDDFSWGETRKVVGDKGGNHGDKEGEFDSSHIVMKRWAEFERDRRWKTARRDISYEGLLRPGSPYGDSGRHSATSSSEHDQPSEQVNLRSSAAQPLSPKHGHVDEQLPMSRSIYPSHLELPAPLAVSVHAHPYNTSSAGEGEHSSAPSSTSQSASPLLVSPAARDYPQPSFADDSERQAMLAASPESPLVASFPSSSPEDAATSSEWVAQAVTAEPQSITAGASLPSRYTGVSLRDDGPVATETGFRSVQRTRRSSQGGARPSRSSVIGNVSPTPLTSKSSLPPGARLS